MTVLDRLGHQLDFVLRVLAALPHAARAYRRQTMLALTDIVWGSGGLVVGGGTAVVLVLLGIAIGGSVGVEGLDALDRVGMAPLTGFVSAYANTRELAPIVAAVGFAAQAGCRMTAEIGAMRIGAEIDALRSLAVRPVAFVVATRVLAGVVAIVPLFLIALIAAYLSCAVAVNVVHGQSPGTYFHYFGAFLRPADVACAVVKAVVLVAAVIVIHCYHGYFASGGPEGVGRACGRAIRASLVLVIVVDMVLTGLFWGADSGIRISG
ncbi:ABC transporter permease [Nocardia pseudobrasiliensis]|uniref:Phospholipid/cholesterol/gamma-HCH transport system permease protein n=1 Tax=Nocardia pseudobrasiliensis TaxID=45979 RepID=A0A370HRY7_9NOCA|nr:ABC transporter permease [Nocardia pseudobrasiliensis]RDI61303.1 phospholipid/cholesterol/gamma-HCH transport system permease protein [Nocardia pseudobrasiliensis]